MHSIQSKPAYNGGSVTCKERVLVPAPCHYYGMTVTKQPGASGCTLCISDSSLGTSAGTGTDIVEYIITNSGNSVASGFWNTKSPLGRKISSGLRCQFAGLTAGGTTVIVWYG